MFSRRRPSILCRVQPVGAAILVFALAVTSGAGTTSTPGSPAAAEPGAVARFLSQLRQAQTGEQASALLAGTKFAEDELRRLDRELAKPEWTQKLLSLQKTVKRSTPARPTLRAHAGKSISQVLEEKRQVLVRAHRERIERGEQAMRARLAAKHAAAGSGARVQVTARSGTAAHVTLPSATVRAQVQRPDWPSHISDLEPRSPTVGQPLTIMGSGFGSNRGAVMFLVGEHLFEAEVTGWTSSLITVRVPHDVRPWDDMGDVPDDVPGPRGQGLGIDCEVWIRLEDGRWGGGRPLGVWPDFELLTPTITAITPTEATPGGRMMIEGTNFGRQQGYGSVSLAFGGAMEVAVREWRNDQIVVQVADDISRLQAMSGGTVKVTNRLRREAVRGGVSFVPAEDVVELQGRKAVVMCHPAGHPLFCWVGDRREFTAFDHQLRNGWTVEESWIDVREIGVNAGAYFERQAERGDTHAYAKMVVWADGLSRAEATPYMIIKGPRGTSPR